MNAPLIINNTMIKNGKTIAMLCNSAWAMYNFRKGLMTSLIEAGYKVLVLAPPDDFKEKIIALGCEFRDVAFDAKSLNPVRELRTLWNILHLLRLEKIDLLFNYTIKPCIYGSWAAYIHGIPSISAITGLGQAFVKDTWLTRMVSFLYRSSLRTNRHVFFLNSDDRTHFLKYHIVSSKISSVLPGEGVDTSWFRPMENNQEDEKVRFLMMARLIEEKGVREYVRAAQLVKKILPRTEFLLMGQLFEEDPRGIKKAEIDSWEEEGLIRYLGFAPDVRPHLAASSCVVLPTYYKEGIPRALLEASAMAKPVVTTDLNGCRDVVLDGESGFLCQIKDVEDLADKMIKIARLPPEERSAMGRLGRDHMLENFDQDVVVERYFSLLRKRKTIRRSLTQSRWSNFFLPAWVRANMAVKK